MNDLDFDDDDFEGFDDRTLDSASSGGKDRPNVASIRLPPFKRPKLTHSVRPSEDDILVHASDDAFDELENAHVPTEPLDFGNDFDDLDPKAFATSPLVITPARSNAVISKSATIVASTPQRANSDIEKRMALHTSAAYCRPPLQNLRQTTLFGSPARHEEVASPVSQQRRNWPLSNASEPPTHHELDLEAAQTWIYPMNLGKVRDYQYNIVAKGLFHNTLVALPTGLGKTFVAAAVMLNWYRWTKTAKIIFVAPTKPLVQQQIHACASIAGIPYSNCTVLTGEVNIRLREVAWEKKRVFFMTPQTLESDLSKGLIDSKQIVLLVVDEAHRATGQFSYVKVVRKISLTNPSFRVLALTATPGADVQAVQQVIDNLRISRVEIRNETSMDLREYVNDREIETQTFTRSGEMVQIMEYYCKALQPLMDVIDAQLPPYMKDPLSLTPFGCTQFCRDYDKSHGGRNSNNNVVHRLRTITTLLAQMAFGMDYLKYHSINAAWEKWKDVKSENMGDDQDKKNKPTKSVYKHKLFGGSHFRDMMETIERWNIDPEFIGHPKLDYLRQVVLNHILDYQEKRKRDSSLGETGIMVFTSFRNSAEIIERCLTRSSALIKSHIFIGQADSKTLKGMNQKKQLAVIEKFKQGEFNVLIATSIGEEGLDIGEVDLIVCYDSKASPLRMLQRMGRTGRKRAGRVVLLQMQGKEEADWLKAKESYKTMQLKITQGREFVFHEDFSRRILPREIQPTVNNCVVEIPYENSQLPRSEVPLLPRKGAKKKIVKKYHMPEGVETGFINATSLNGPSNPTARPRGRPKKTTDVAETVAVIQPDLVDEPEECPRLKNVVLNSTQQVSLRKKYQYCHFDDDGDTEASGVISGPSLDKFPELQRSPGPTKFVTHGHRSKQFAGLMNQIAELDEYSLQEYEVLFDKNLLSEGPDLNAILLPENPSAIKEPCDSPDLPTLKRAKPPAKMRKLPNSVRAIQSNVHSGMTKKTKESRPQSHIVPSDDQPIIFNADEAAEGNASSPPATDPRFALRTQGVDVGSQDTEPPSSNALAGEDTMDSSMRDFIVDDDEVIAEMEAHENTIDSSMPSVLNLRDDADCKADKRFKLLTSDDLGNASDDSSLPDMDDLMPAKKKNKKKAKIPLNAGRRKGIATVAHRRIIYDSDDDEVVELR